MQLAQAVSCGTHFLNAASLRTESPLFFDLIAFLSSVLISAGHVSKA
jgi:hypothetical protein